MRCAFHIHTCYSLDCRTKLETIKEFCLEKNVEVIIITDHDTIEGALKLAKISHNKITVITGEEIQTNKGEIIGLFLNTAIAPLQSPEETIIQIKKQNGIVCVPHPFDSLRRKRIEKDTLGRIVDDIDIVEVFNSRNIFSKDNTKALEFAKNNSKTVIAGSDAHTKNEIVNAIHEIEPFNSKEEFLNNLEKSKIHFKKSPLYVHLITKLIKLDKVLN